MKTTTRQTNLIQFGDENLDLSGLEQLIEKSQTRAIAEALCLLRSWISQPQASGSSLAQLLKRMDAEFDSQVCSARDQVLFSVAGTRIACVRTEYVGQDLNFLCATGSRCAGACSEGRELCTTAHL